MDTRRVRSRGGANDERCADWKLCQGLKKVFKKFSKMSKKVFLKVKKVFKKYKKVF